MKLFHGTHQKFDKIDLSKSLKGKDFGRGFYLTPDETVAKRQATRKFKMSGRGIKSVLICDFDEHFSKRLRILRFDGYSKEWAEFILKNRNNRTNDQIHDYDIVIGPIADDTVGLQIRRYIEGVISLDQFVEELKYKKVTWQYFFGTPASIETLNNLEWYEFSD